MEVDMSRFAVPKSFRPGVLPRQSKFGLLPGTPVFSESPYPILSDDEIIDILKSENRPDGRELVPDGVDQGGNNSCASACKENLTTTLRNGEGRTFIKFNELPTYGRVNGGRDGGSSLDENIAFAAKYGSFPESVVPRSKGWQYEPTEAEYAEAYKYRLKERYDIDNTSSSRYYTELFSALVSTDKPAVEAGYPGHAILLVGLMLEEDAPQAALECAHVLDDYMLKAGLLPTLSSRGGLSDKVIIPWRNSWGNEWGDNGFGYIYASRLAVYYGAFVGYSTTEA
jgi:hypothetical protein